MYFFLKIPWKEKYYFEIHSILFYVNKSKKVKYGVLEIKSNFSHLFFASLPYNATNFFLSATSSVELDKRSEYTG